MVKLVSVIFFNCIGDRDPAIILSCFNVDSFGFFQSGGVKEFCTFASRESSKRCDGGTMNTILHKGYKVHVKKFLSGLALTCVSDEEYPNQAARGFLQKSLELFNTHNKKESDYNQISKDTNLNLPGLSNLLLDCSANPSKADIIFAIQQDLDETKEICQKTVDQLFERGESLNDLIEKSEDISIQSKIMLERSEAINSRCCVLF